MNFLLIIILIILFSIYFSIGIYFFKNKNVLRIGFKNFPLGWFSDVLAVLEFSDFRNIFSISFLPMEHRLAQAGRQISIGFESIQK